MIGWKEKEEREKEVGVSLQPAEAEALFGHSSMT
jgi:hypothetical protein